MSVAPTSVALLLAAALFAIGGLRARLRCLLLVALACLLLADPFGPLRCAGAADGTGLLAWSLETGAPIAGAGLMLIAALDAWRPFRGAVRPPRQRPSAPAQVTAHVGLRAVIAFLVGVLAFGAASVAPSLREAAPQLLSYAAAFILMLVVWALWPLLPARRPPADSASP